LFRPEHVNTLAAMLAANITVPYRFVCITDDPRGIDAECMEIWPDPGYDGKGRARCWRRLKLFEPETAAKLGRRIVQIDLDCVITGSLDALLATPGDLVLMEGTRSRVTGRQVCRFNGSLWMFDAGTRPELWSRLNQHEAWKVAAQTIDGRPVTGSDQAWFMAHAPDAATVGIADGVAQFHTHGEADQRLVFFAGGRKPWERQAGRLHMAWRAYRDGRVKPARRTGGDCLVIGKGNARDRMRQMTDPRWSAVVATVDVLPGLPVGATVNGVTLSVASGEQWARDRGMEPWIIGETT
jgi:hypothetical protein